MGGRDRTNEFFEFIRIQTKSRTNAKFKSTKGSFEDSVIITTGKQMV